MKKRTIALLIAAVMLSILLCGALTACDKAGTAADPEPVESEIADVVSEPESEPESSEPEAKNPHEYPYSWYTEKKAVLADMTSEEACAYLVAFFLSGGTAFTDANTLSPSVMTMLLQYKNSHAWEEQPEIWEPGGVRMTYDEVVEELQHYLDFDPSKVELKNLKYGVPYDPETDTYLFSCDLGGTCPIIPLDDKWEGDRRLITFGYDPEYDIDLLPDENEPKYNSVFTLEQNGEYIRYVSYEMIPAE